MVEMSPYLIRADGCDDRTEALVHLTTSQAATARMIAEAVTENGGGCQPTMEVHEVEPAGSEQWADFYDHATQLSFNIKEK